MNIRLTEEGGKMWLASIIECLGIGLVFLCFVIGLTKLIKSIIKGWNTKKEGEKK